MQTNSVLFTGIIAFIVGISLGMALGYILHDIFHRILNVDDSMSKVFIIIIVGLAWFISVIISWLNPNYTVPLQVHLLMGGIVGYFFSKGINFPPKT